MKKLKNLLLASLSILSFWGCDKKNICDPIFKEAMDKLDSKECLELSTLHYKDWDTLYVISSNMYPDEIEDITGVPYPYSMHYDPNKVLLFTNNGKVVSRQCGRCLNVSFSTQSRVRGITTISKEESCIRSIKDPHGYLFLTVD